jgi:hypothetical protein
VEEERESSSLRQAQAPWSRFWRKGSRVCSPAFAG